MPILGPYGGSVTSQLGSSPLVTGEFHLGPTPNMFGATAIDATDDAAVESLAPANTYAEAVALRESVRANSTMSQWDWRVANAVAQPSGSAVNIDIEAISIPTQPWGTVVWNFPIGAVISWIDLAVVEHTLPATTITYPLSHSGASVTATIVAPAGSFNVAIPRHQPLFVDFPDPSPLNWFTRYDALGEGVILYYSDGGDNYIRYEAHLGNNEWAAIEIAQSTPGGVTQNQVNALIATARGEITTEISDSAATKQDVLPALTQFRMWTHDGTGIVAAARRENLDEFKSTFANAVNSAITTTVPFTTSYTLPLSMRTLIDSGMSPPHLALAVTGNAQGASTTIRVTITNTTDSSQVHQEDLVFGSTTETQTVYVDRIPHNYTIGITGQVGSTQLDSISGVLTVSDASFTTLVDTPDDYSAFGAGSPVVINTDGDGLGFTAQSAGFTSGGQVVTTYNYGWNLHDDHLNPTGAWMDADANLWICDNTPGSDAEIFVYDPYGVLLNRLVVPDISIITDVVCDDTRMWVADRSDGFVRAYSRPDITSGGVSISPARDAARDFDTTFTNLNGITIDESEEHIHVIDSRATRSRGRRYFRATGVHRDGYHFIDSPFAVDLFRYENNIYTLIAGSNVRRVNTNSYGEQSTVLTPQDDDDDAVTLTAIMRDAGTWWGVTSDRTVLAWDVVTSAYLIPGEPRPATIETFGVVRYSVNDDLDQGVTGRTDRAVNTENLLHWASEHQASDTVRGFAIRAADDVNDLGTDNDGFMTADLVRDAVDGIHRQMWYSVRQYHRDEPPDEHHHTVGPASFGIPVYSTNNIPCITSQRDGDFFLAAGRRLFLFDPFRGRVLEEVGTDIFPSGVGSIGFHEDELIAVLLDGYSMVKFSNFPTNITSYSTSSGTGNAPTVTGANRFYECPKLVEHGSSLYAMDQVDESFYRIDPADISATQLTGAVAGWGSVGKFNPVDVITLNDHVWMGNDGTGVTGGTGFYRVTNNAGVIQQDVHSTDIFQTSHGVSAALSLTGWRGQVYSTELNSSEMRFTQFGGVI